MLVTERTPIMQEPLAIEGVALGIRRLRRDKDDLFVQVTPKFRTRIEFSMAIGELSISVVMVLDCLFGVLWMDESAIPSKLGMVGVPCCCDSLVSVFAQWDA